MTLPQSSLSPFAPGTLALGDIVSFPPDVQHTVRAVIRFRSPYGSVAGFVLLGEFDAAMSIPALQSVPAEISTPRDPSALDGQQVMLLQEGVTRYWAPHVPAVPGAMSEVKFKVLAVRGQEQPVLMCFRGPEKVVFVRLHSVWMSDVGVASMGLAPALDGPAVARKSGDVQLDTTAPFPLIAEPDRTVSEPLRTVPAPSRR